MNLKEYIKKVIVPRKPVDLKMIYQDLMNLGYSAHEIYLAIQERVLENIHNIINDYKKKYGGTK